MDFSPFDSMVSFIALISLVGIFIISARALPLGPLSLPCITVLTSVMYFYVIPIISLESGVSEYLGMYLTSLRWTHFLILLYTAGAGVAFFMQRRTLFADLSSERRDEKPINMPIYYGLCGIAVIAVASQIAMGKLNVLGAEDYAFSADTMTEYAFVTEGYNMLVPLTLVFLIEHNFQKRFLLILLPVVSIFIEAGFRFRILILASALCVSVFLVRKIKVRVSYVFVGAVLVLFVSNLIGTIRKYGQGVDFSALEDISWDKFFTSTGGEFGIVVVTSSIVENPLPDPVLFEPWIVGFSRLVPRFLWPDKPVASYLDYLVANSPYEYAVRAGAAAPQQIEMLLQFGWFGVPVLAFIYFSLAVYLLSRLNRLGREARIAGCGLVPIYFGYYMQTRGYFFQIFVDSLFMFGPLFVVHMRGKSGDPGRDRRPSRQH